MSRRPRRATLAEAGQNEAEARCYKEPTTGTLNNGNLDGYDLVYTVTQDTINRRLQTLYSLGVLPSIIPHQLKSQNPELPEVLNLTFGPPEVDLLYGAQRIVRAYFPVIDGGIKRYSFKQVAPNVWQPVPNTLS